jgi:ribokinase
MSSKITVAGSISVDLVIASDRLPLPGETIRGSRFQWMAGGKGADQAVAAARQGVSISFVGCAGDDKFGSDQKKNLANDKIDVQCISEIKNESPYADVMLISGTIL